MKESRIRSDNSELLRLYYSTAVPSKRPYREHHHTELEISLCTAGRGVYTVKERQYDILPGDIFLFGTYEAHYITDITEEIKLMNLHFEPRFIWANRSEMFDYKYLKIFFYRSPSFQNRLARSNPATGKIRELMLELETEFEQRGSEYEMMAKIKLLTILVLLIREYDYVDNGNKHENIKIRNISAAMKYIDENLDKELLLDELAYISGMNKTYFITIFKQLNGVTPWEYITARRIELASNLLCDKCESVLSVSEKCGFGSASSFNRAFKKTVGCTPTEWRRKQLEE